MSRIRTHNNRRRSKQRKDAYLAQVSGIAWLNDIQIYRDSEGRSFCGRPTCYVEFIR